MIQSDVEKLNQSPPFPEFRSVRYDPETMNLTFLLKYPPPHNEVNVRVTKQFVASYPSGTPVSMMVGDHFHVVPLGPGGVAYLAEKVNELCALSLRDDTPVTGQMERIGSNDSEGALYRPSSSWIVEPTVMYERDEDGCCAGINPSLLTDLSKLRNRKAILSDHPEIGKSVVSLFVEPLSVLPEPTCAAWSVNAGEPIEIRLTLHRDAYLTAPVAVEVGQTDNFRSGNFSGLVGQLQHILQTFTKNVNRIVKSDSAPLAQLVELGFDESIATMALSKTNFCVADACRLLTQQTEEEIFSGKIKIHRSLPSVLEKKAIPSGKDGFFVQLLDYAIQRIPSMSEFCVICDRPHVFSSGIMVQSSVCSRELCVFRYQQLDVAKNVATSVAIQTGVIDFLVVLAKHAANSSRWKLIFEPYPLLIGDDGAAIMTPDNKDIDLAKSVLKAIPPMRDIALSDSADEVRKKLEAGHPLAFPLFRWIISSNRSWLMKLPSESQIPFMKTQHQYILLQDSVERQKAFEELKKAHGTLWAFHGSRAENWHSILRNGLKNASGTKLQLNGTAHGSGIYLSPQASVSFGYSQISTSQNRGRELDPFEKEFLDLNSLHCVAVCEVVNKDIKKSGNIWVTPHENCVATRFLFVFQHNESCGGSIALNDQGNSDILSSVMSQLCSA